MDNGSLFWRNILRLVCPTILAGSFSIEISIRQGLPEEEWQEIPKLRGVVSVKWYASDRAIFGQFPVAVSPRVYIADADKIHHYLTGASELQNDGKIFFVIQRNKRVFPVKKNQHVDLYCRPSGACA